MIKTRFMGIEINSPLVAASSSVSANFDTIKTLSDSGIGAVVLKSIFQEQIAGEITNLLEFADYPEAADYLSHYVKENDLNKVISLIAKCKSELETPIIASINATSEGSWIEFCKKLADAGADALELNIFFMPTSKNETSAQLEQRYLDLAETVVKAVNVPVAVKLSPRFTSHINIVSELYKRGVKAVTLFNRFWEPDFDIDSECIVAQPVLSSPGEARSNLRLISQISAECPAMEIAATTAIHNHEDVIKALLAGATTVQLCSVLYEKGTKEVYNINAAIFKWMEDKDYCSIESFRGSLNCKNISDKKAYDRMQFIKNFDTYR